jgi:hypothetical protein
MDARTLVLPADDCRRLRHPTSWQQVSPGGDRIEVCQLCSLAVREALRAGLSGELADAFVRTLRADTEPYGADEEGTTNDG